MTDPVDWRWSDEYEPTIEGWYAVLYGWDPQEGIFPGAVEWKDQKWDWDSNATVCRWGGPFLNEEAADKWARDRYRESK